MRRIRVIYIFERLEDAFDDVLTHMNSGVPDDFRKQFIIGSFVETVKWWIGTGLELAPEEVVMNYIAMLGRI